MKPPASSSSQSRLLLSALIKKKKLFFPLCEKFWNQCWSVTVPSKFPHHGLVSTRPFWSTLQKRHSCLSLFSIFRCGPNSNGLLGNPLMVQATLSINSCLHWEKAHLSRWCKRHRMLVSPSPHSWLLIERVLKQALC